MYFHANDLSPAEGRVLCSALRQLDILVCLPRDAAAPGLAALPFTAAILHYDRDPAGLPSIARLHTCYPGLPLIAIGSAPAEPGQWRSLPGADYEPENNPQEIAALLAFLRQKHGILRPHRTSLYLSDDRRRVMVLTQRIAFSRDEFTLLRVLAASDAPLPSTLLCCFGDLPDERRLPKTVAFHVQRIKEKAIAVGVPPLIRCIRPDGYTLAPPYDIRLSE